MHTQRIALLALLLLLTPGCMLRARRMEGQLQPLVGRPVAEAVSELGPPTSTYAAGPGTTLYVWERSGGAVATGNPYYVAARQLRCKVWLDVDDSGTVVDWHWEGDC